MTFEEKKLYHQIHSFKLCVDISSGFLTTYLAWQHNVVWFLLLLFLPSVIVSLLVIQYVNLEYIKESRLGKYIEKYMTSRMEAFRLLGQIIMWIAAWFHLPYLILIGFLLIIIGWCNGVVVKSTSRLNNKMSLIFLILYSLHSFHFSNLS